MFSNKYKLFLGIFFSKTEFMILCLRKNEEKLIDIQNHFLLLNNIHNKYSKNSYKIHYSKICIQTK